jgi:hypothetical protein
MAPEKVARWRARFLAGGHQALQTDAPRPDRPHTVSESTVRRNWHTNRQHHLAKTFKVSNNRKRAETLAWLTAQKGPLWNNDPRLQTQWNSDLFAARNTLDGSVISSCENRHHHQEWLKFLRLMDQSTPPDQQLHLIAGNYATHKHCKIQQGLARHPRFSMQFPHSQFPAQQGRALLPRSDRQAYPPGRLSAQLF